MRGPVAGSSCGVPSQGPTCSACCRSTQVPSRGPTRRARAIVISMRGRERERERKCCALHFPSELRSRHRVDFERGEAHHGFLSSLRPIALRSMSDSTRHNEQSRSQSRAQHGHQQSGGRAESETRAERWKRRELCRGREQCRSGKQRRSQGRGRVELEQRAESRVRAESGVRRSPRAPHTTRHTRAHRSGQLPPGPLTDRANRRRRTEGRGGRGP